MTCDHSWKILNTSAFGTDDAIAYCEKCGCEGTGRGEIIEASKELKTQRINKRMSEMKTIMEEAEKEYYRLKKELEDL